MTAPTTVATPATQKGHNHLKLSLARYRILAALRTMDGVPLSRTDLFRFTRCKVVAIGAALDDMTASGLVARDGQRHYIITHQGRAALGRHTAQRRRDTYGS